MKVSILVSECMILALLAGCNLPATPTPASTPTSVPPGAEPRVIDPLPLAAEYLTGAKILSYDPLNTMDSWTFNSETGTPMGGVFQLRGTPRWQSSFWYDQQFPEGRGLTIRFAVQYSNARSEFVLVTGEWMTDTFRQFGVYNAVIPKGDLFQGTRNLGGYNLQGNLNILSNTWYNLLLAVGRNGHFLAVVWDPANPTRRVVYDLLGGPNWAGRSWVFLPKANTGETVYVDDFYRLAFTDIK